MTVPQWTMGLLVTGGNLTVSGSGTYGGDGVGSDPRPITVLMTGASKVITLSGTPTVSGLLFDASGTLKNTSAGGSVKGTVLCGGGVTASGSLAVNYNSSEAVTTLDTTPPAGSLQINGGAAWTTGTAVTLTTSASDGSGGSGLAQMRFSSDNSTWGAWQTYATSAPWTLPAGDGTKTVYVQYQDKAGNVSVAVSAHIGLDTTAPTTSAAPSGTLGSHGWYTSSVAVALTAKDATSGVASTSYSLDGVAGSGTTVNITTDGAHTVKYWSTDKAGNVEAQHTLTVSVDRTPPVTTAKVAGTSGNNCWYTSAVTVTLTATDPASGVASTSYSLDGVVGSGTTVSITTDGIHTVKYWSVDKAGNTECQHTLTVDVDRTPPATSATPSGTVGSNGWYTGAVKVTLTASDNMSGVAGTYYTVDGGATQCYSSCKPFTVSGDAVHTVKYWSTDKAGNTETQHTLTLGIDTTPPVTTIVRTSGTLGTNGWYTSAMAVTLGASDNLSGVASTLYTLDGVASSGTTVNITTDGIHTVNYWSVDKAGNAEGQHTLTVDVDQTAPTNVQITSPANLSFTNDTTPTLSYSASDPSPGSGLVTTGAVAQVDGSLVSASFQSGGSLAPLLDGAHTVTVTVFDMAGNSTSATSTFIVDTVPPVVAIMSPTDTSQLSNGAPTLQYNLDDPTATVAVTMNGAPTSVANGQRLAPPTVPLADGSYTVKVTATDAAGNVGSDTTAFTVDAADGPSAGFTYAPDAVYEGDAVGLYADDTGNPGGSQADRTWQWSVGVGDNDPSPASYTGPVGFVVPGSSGTWTVELAVTDTVTGKSNSTEQQITVLPQAPRAQALNVDVLQNQPADLVARFVDPAWLDSHSATWTIGNSSRTGSVTEDNDTAMDSGYVTGHAQSFSDTGSYDASLQVTNSESLSAQSSFKINVIANDPSRDEPNDSFATATPLDGEQAHLSWIQSTGDVDIYEVLTPDGKSLPYGTQVLATLRNLPADYDLAVIQDLGSDVAADSQAPTQDAAFENTTLQDARCPTRRAQDGAAPHGAAPHGAAAHGAALHGAAPHGAAHGETPHGAALRAELLPRQRGGRVALLQRARHGAAIDRTPLDYCAFVHGTPDTLNNLDGYPLSDMICTNLNDDKTAGSDMTFEELGFTNEDIANKRIAGFSAASGTAPEVVLAKTDFVGGHTYVAVKGANGAYSDQPYTLQIETSQPPDVLPVANEGLISKPLMSTPTPESTPVQTATDQGPLTLFVTQTQRIDAIYGTATDTQPFENDVLPTLKSACALPSVKGEVISVPSVYYDQWDEQPWDTE